MKSDLISMADIRRETRLPAHVIDYAIERYGPEPIGRIGITRVWRRDQLLAIKASIARTERPSRQEALA